MGIHFSGKRDAMPAQPRDLRGFRADQRTKSSAMAQAEEGIEVQIKIAKMNASPRSSKNPEKPTPARYEAVMRQVKKPKPIRYRLSLSFSEGSNPTLAVTRIMYRSIGA